MKKDKVSVIIPVYNVDKYIGRCIESVINQTYTNLEILLVNDGSTDKSGDICNNYAKTDNRIIVIHKENSGVSESRNYGIRKATGKWIIFIDSDDYIELNMIQELYNCTIMDSECDLVVCNYFEKNDINNTNKNKEIVLSRIEALDNITLDKEIKGFVWNKLFRKDIMDSYNIQFNKNLHMCEDLSFCIQYIDNSRKIIYTSIPLYHYETRSESVSCNVFSEKRYSVIYAYDYIMNLSCIKDNEVLHRRFKNRKIRQSLLLLKIIYADRKSKITYRKYVLQIKKFIKLQGWEYLKQKNEKIKYKILFIIIKLL